MSGVADTTPIPVSGTGDPVDIAGAMAKCPQAFTRPLRQRIILIAIWVLGIAFTVFALNRTGFLDLERLILGLDKLGFVLSFMLPPAHNGYFWDFMGGIGETLAMAFLGTFMAAIMALPLGFLGAKNVIPQWAFHFGLRRVFDGIRSIDSLIWALVFINVVGLGPFAGILAIAVADTGIFAKLFSEAIEGVDRREIDGVKASGGGQLQIMRFGILPQVFPVMLSHVLYFFESNTRSATILGVVGAGGIGLQLSDRIRVNNWDEACFIILMILVTVYIIDVVSKRIRERFIRPPENVPQVQVPA